jgi:hypothetical protein
LLPELEEGDVDVGILGKLSGRQANVFVRAIEG